MIPAKHDSRRFTFLDVSAERVPDYAYFDALVKWQKNPRRNASRVVFGGSDLGFTPEDELV